MSDVFVGRRAELARLQEHLDRVAARRSGLLVSMRGRRQVGKSRLAEEFLAGVAVPSVFFPASQGADPARERRRFVDVTAASSLEAAEIFRTIRSDDWLSLFEALAAHTTTPSVVVLDELPYLLEGDLELEGILQTAWDRHMAHAPILMLTLGSNISVMEQLTTHGRPLFGRAREMRLDPLTVADTADFTGLDAPAAFDAQLVLGGYPRILQEWEAGTTVTQFLAQQLMDSTSPLVVVGERIVTAEFPTELQSGAVLRAIGADERTFSGLAQRLDINHGSLSRALRMLSDGTRVVSPNRPLSRRRSNDTRYQVADQYLRFWLRFIQPRIELLFRGRGNIVVQETLAKWPTYRGTAIEPLVRQSIERLLPHPPLGETRFVGSYWNRTGDVEVDLVGADADRAPATVTMVGSVKWRENGGFGRDDLLALAASRQQVPGAESALLAGVSRTGFRTADLDAAFDPQDLLAAWR